MNESTNILKVDPYIHKDPLKEVYHDQIIDNPEQFEFLVSHKTALLCIDIQYLDAVEGYGVFREPEKSGVPEEGRKYYFDRLKRIVVPNTVRLQTAFREYGLEVVHTRIKSLTKDGRDRSEGHKRLKLLAPPGSKEAEFLEEIAPIEDEIVIDKTASGVFPSTNLHYVLQNMDINALFVLGVYTNECVESTVRYACDLGYFVTVIDDACATVTPALHDASLATLKDRYARVVDTEQALQDLAKFASTRG